MLCVAVAAGIGLLPVKGAAAEYTYSGTVSDKTVADKLFLATNGGVVEIMIDSDTEMVNAKFLLPGNSVTANCFIGSDEYWHASKITGNTSAGKVSLDTSKKSTVKGSIAKGTSEELLYLVVDNGTMQIKIDESTDVEGIKCFIIGKTVEAEVARGSDSYMHALSITDLTTYSKSGSSTVSATGSGSGITGTVEKGTTTSLLYLNTSGGTMQIVLDLSTDASASRVLIPGQSVTVNFYRGSDAWNHASKIVNNNSKAADVVSLDESSKFTVTGTVTSKSTENTLYLNTSGGVMQIRLNSSTDFSKCPVLLLDKKVEVVCERGSDEYNHAVQVVAK
jgi:hypothetical protein